MVVRKKKLKKRSAARSRPPEPLVFFIDHSLGQKTIAKALRDAGAKVEIHDDHFPQDTKDHVWLAEVGDHGWVVLMKDKNIRFNELERTTLTRAGVKSFVITAGNIKGEEMAQILVNKLPSIVRFINNHAAPFIDKITRGGTISLLIDK